MKEFWRYFKENIKQVFIDLRSKDREVRRKQIPNVLTLIRGVVAPITIIPAVICRRINLAFILIAICALTDSFDGWYARNRNAQSEFGALLDTICDKFFVLTLAFPLVFIHTKWILGILFLELIISIINSYSKVKGYETHSSKMGKIKTFVLDIAIANCYLNFIVRVPDVVLGIVAILANVLQICSIFGYFMMYRVQVSEKELNKV